MDRGNVRRFALNSEDLKIKELINREFLELELNAISDQDPNDNRSFFELSAIQDAVPSIKNKPVLGSFDPGKGNLGDFNGHNDNGLHYDSELQNAYFDYSAKNSERIIGVIRESDKAYIEYDEVTKLNWLKFTCCIWCAYSYKAVKSLLKSRNGRSNVSVEIEVEDSYIREDGVEVIKKFNFLGVTILGADVRPGIAGAALSVVDFVKNQDYEKSRHFLDFAYNALDEYNNNLDVVDDCKRLIEKGGTEYMDTDNEKFAAEDDEKEKEKQKETEACGCGSDEDGTKNAPDKQEESCDCGKKEEEACGEKQVEACDCGKKEEEACDCDKKLEEACGCEGKEDDKPEKENEACEKSNCACGEKESEACGEEDGADKDGKENEACGKENEACGKENEACGCEGEEPKKEDEACKNELQFASVEVDGVSVDINQLLEKYEELRKEYSTLQDNYNSLNLSVQKERAESLITFASNRVAKDNLPVSDRDEIVEKISQKCKSFELTTEEQVEEYATNLLAVYFYTNRETANGGGAKNRFSISIERPATKSGSKSGCNSALELSIKALEKI